MASADAPRSTARSRASAGLSRAGIVAAAIDLADEEGLDAVSMRRIAQRLAVDPMSLYRHVGAGHGGDSTGLTTYGVDGNLRRRPTV